MAASDPNGGSYYSSANSSYPSWKDSLKYNPSSGVLNKSGSMVFPIAEAIGAIGQIGGAVLGAFGQNQQSKVAKDIASWQIRAEEAARFQGLLASQNAATYGKQFDMGLQRDAANYQQAFLDPRKSILGVEDYNRRIAAELGPFGRKLSQQESSGEINKLLAGKFMPMFDSPNKPFSYGRSPGYTTGSLV